LITSIVFFAPQTPQSARGAWPATAGGRGKMGQGRETGNEQSCAAPDFMDMREAPRFALLIRSAKLICDSGEYLCIIRDVSETGVRLRLFHPLPPDQLLTLELAT